MITNWAIAGTGFAAKDFISKVDRNKYNILAVFDIDESLSQDFSNKYDIELSYTDFEKMISNDSIQGVYIATPNQTHYPLMLKAINAGKHIICEKVITFNLNQYNKIQKLANEKNLIIIEGMTLFYMPLFPIIRQLIMNNKLGRLSVMNVSFGSSKKFNAQNRYFDKKKGGGALFDIGTYVLSALVLFMGTDVDLIHSQCVFSGTGVDEKSIYILKNKKMVLGNAVISFCGKLPKQIIISGEKGYITINDFPRAKEAILYWNSGKRECIQSGNESDIFNLELETINQYYLNKPPILEDVRLLTKKVVSLMDECRKEWNLHYPDEEV